MSSQKINKTNNDRENGNNLILMTSILFAISFIISVFLGAVFDNMVIASMPIILFWLNVISHTSNVMKNS